MSQLIHDVSELNAQQVLVEASMEHPVLVQFWAPDSPPCAELSPVLEKLVNQYQGRFTLARVNCQVEYGLVQHFRIQTLPTLYLIHKGQPVDGLAGPQTEDAVKALLDKHLPDLAGQALAQGQQALAEERFDDALALFSQAKEDGAPDNAELHLALAHCYLGLSRLDEAQAQLDAIAEAERSQAFQDTLQLLEEKRQAADTPAIQALQEQLAAQPDDHQSRLALATELSQVGRHEEALAALLIILKQDLAFADGQARQLYQDMLNTLGQGNALAAQYRRALFSLLY